jgi:antitoxin MazE
MTKTLTRHGNSLALVIDKPILELLRIDDETPLEITTDGNKLIIEPRSPEREKRFRKALKETNDQYGRMLKKLAE